MKKFKLRHKIAAAFTAGLLMDSAEAMAQITGGASGTGGFEMITDEITQSTGQLPQLITTTAYIGGIGLAVAGILKLKGHVDAPQQVPLKDGLVRLGAGGGLLALPMVLDAMASTIGDGSASAPELTKITPIAY